MRSTLQATLTAGLALLLTAACAADSSPGEKGPGSAWAASADRDLMAAMQPAGSWAVYGRDFANTRWSPLTQINTTDVRALRPVWVYHSRLPYSSESNPVVVNGVIYLSTALNHVLALDARTGARLWEYVHDYRTTTDCCAAVNRGVAVYGGRVYMGTVDARLVSLDARTGKKLWDISVGDPTLGYHITGAPLVVDGRVITGVSGGEQGARCWVDAYDARTGDHLWRWYTIPSPQEGGWWGTWRQTDEWGMSFHRDIAQEKRDSARYANAWQHGGGPMWHHPAYDPATGLLYMNIGNAAPDLDGEVRPGDNLYTSSIVAVELRTGKLHWYYQEVSHGVWDYDATTPPVLLDVPDATGRMIRAVAEAGKDGFVYVLDRATGKPIRKSQPFVPLLNYMQPPTKQGVYENPGTLGGSDWSPTSYSPQTGYMYVNGNFLPMLYRVNHEPLLPPAQWWSGTTQAAQQGNYGIFSAIDLASGRIAWQYRMSKPTISGSVATAGGLVFTGASDKHLLAFDARTGAVLWSWPTDAAVNAPPITYVLDGKQYIAVAATGIQTLNTPRGDALWVFALGAAAPAGPHTPAGQGAGVTPPAPGARRAAPDTMAGRAR